MVGYVWAVSTHNNYSNPYEQLSAVLWAVSTRKRSTVPIDLNSCPPYCGQYLRESGQLESN